MFQKLRLLNDSFQDRAPFATLQHQSVELRRRRLQALFTKDPSFQATAIIRRSEQQLCCFVVKRHPFNYVTNALLFGDDESRFLT